MKISRAAAEQAISERIAKPLDYDLTQAAAGILQIVNVQMAEATKSVSIERGFDPRDFAMLAFGSAGPMHAVRLADDIGIKNIVIPLAPGITSALGLLLSDVKMEFVLSRLEPITEVDVSLLNGIFEKAESEYTEKLHQEGLDEVSLQRYLDMRYYGQGYELSVEVPQSRLEEKDLIEIRKAFDMAHKTSYGISAQDREVEIVTYRLVAMGRTPKPLFKEWPSSGNDASQAIKNTRKVYSPISRDYVKTSVYDRNKLRVGNLVTGPAIVEQMDSTTVIPENYTLELDSLGNLLIKKVENRAA